MTTTVLIVLVLTAHIYILMMWAIMSEISKRQKIILEIVFDEDDTKRQIQKKQSELISSAVGHMEIQRQLIDLMDDEIELIKIVIGLKGGDHETE